MPAPRITAVIPAYNEGRRIADTLAAVRPYVDQLVVVDDGSADDTAAAASASGTEAVVLRHSLNRGQGAALRTGTEAALRLGAEIIVHVDADGQHDPSFIPGLVAPVVEGRADIVFGSRFLGETPAGMPAARWALLAFARWFNAFAMGIPRRVSDPQSGLRALSRAGARALNFRQDRMAHCSEILRLVTRSSSSLRWVEVPARVHYTSATLAKGQGSFDAMKIAWQLLLGVFAD